ncbi:Proteasome beta type [Salix suchowensis]|nr:Proteasome beta type [Salix suchowensis]
MDHFPTNWGRPRNDAFDAYGTYPIAQHPRNAVDVFADGVQRTQQPIVTGTSVLAIKYKDGIMMAADNLASYGSLARFKDVQRLHPVGDHTVIGAGGDMSDFQYIQQMLEDLIHEYMSHVMYARRSKINPLWNSLVIGGFKNGKSFLSYIDLLGTTYTASTIATGYGSMIAQPLLRKAVEGNETILTEEEALKIIESSMRVLFYRDARSINKVCQFQVATITEKGATISESRHLETSWSFAEGSEVRVADAINKSYKSACSVVCDKRWIDGLVMHLSSSFSFPRGSTAFERVLKEVDDRVLLTVTNIQARVGVI